MIHKTKAVQALIAGCKHERLPEATAVELVRYLQAKRWHDTFLREADRPRNMSPGTTLDRLWHHMLLNTDTSSMVHELVGGVVRHIGTDERSLNDEEKLMQRLYAMKVMASIGWRPNVRLWEEPNSIMSSISTMNFPDGSDMYIATGMSPASIVQLRRDVRQFSSSSSGHNGGTTQQQATVQPTALSSDSDVQIVSHSKVSVSESDSEADSEPVPKRSRLQQFEHGISVFIPSVDSIPIPSNHGTLTAKDMKQHLGTILNLPAQQLRILALANNGTKERIQQLSDGDTAEGCGTLRLLLPGDVCPAEAVYALYVNRLTGETITVAARCGNTLADIKRKIQDKEGIPPQQQRLLYAGRVLDDDRTLWEYGIRSKTLLHLVLSMPGC